MVGRAAPVCAAAGENGAQTKNPIARASAKTRRSFTPARLLAIPRSSAFPLLRKVTEKTERRQQADPNQVTILPPRAERRILLQKRQARGFRHDQTMSFRQCCRACVGFFLRVRGRAFGGEPGQADRQCRCLCGAHVGSGAADLVDAGARLPGNQDHRAAAKRAEEGGLPNRDRRCGDSHRLRRARRHQ